MENDTFVSFISSFLLEPPPEPREHPGGSKVDLSPPLHHHHHNHHNHNPHHLEEEEEEEEDTAIIGVDNFVEVPFSHDVHLVALRDRAFSWDVSLENDKFLPDQLLGGLVTHDHNHHVTTTATTSSSSSSKNTSFYRPKVFTGKEDHQTVHSHNNNNHNNNNSHVISESFLKLEHDHDLVHDMVHDDHFLLDGEGELFADDDLLPSDYPLSSYEGGAGGSSGSGADMPVSSNAGGNTRARPRIRLSLKAESQSPAPTTNSTERNRTGGNSRKRTYSDQNNKGGNTKKEGSNATGSSGGNNGGGNNSGNKSSNNRNRGSGGGGAANNNSNNNSIMEGSNGSAVMESGSPSLHHTQSIGQLSSLSQPQQQALQQQQQQQVQPPTLLQPNQVSLQQMAGLASGAGGSGTTFTYPELAYQSSGAAMTAGSSSSMGALGSNPALLLPGTMGSMQSSIISLAGTMGGNDRRVGAYTIEERRLKIEKFRERKRQRIWRKQIKYDCRKRLADTRPRVKGRFVSRKKLNAEGGGGGEDGNNDGSGDEDDEGNGGNRDNNNEDEEGGGDTIAKDLLGHSLPLNRETSVGMESVASSTNYPVGTSLSTSYNLLNSTSQASSSGALPGTGLNRPPHTLASIPNAPSSSMIANTVSGSMVGAGSSGSGGFASIVSGPSILATALTTGLVPSMSATVAPGITTTTLTLPALTVPSSVNVGMGIGVGSSLNVGTASSSSMGIVGGVSNGQLPSISGATVSSSPLYSNGTLAGQQSFNGAVPPNLMNTALYTSTADHNNNVHPHISTSSSLSLTSSTTTSTTTVMK
eukprot:gene4501-4937_t